MGDGSEKQTEAVRSCQYRADGPSTPFVNDPQYTKSILPILYIVMVFVCLLWFAANYRPNERSERDSRQFCSLCRPEQNLRELTDYQKQQQAINARIGMNPCVTLP